MTKTTKKYLTYIKLIAITLIPYAHILSSILLILYQNQLSNDVDYATVNDQFQRIQMVATILQGALIAIWLYLVYNTSPKLTIMTVLINLTIIIGIIVYTLIPPSNDVMMLNYAYYLLSSTKFVLLLFVGLHIFALLCLIFAKNPFEQDTQQVIVQKVVETPHPTNIVVEDHVESQKEWTVETNRILKPTKKVIEKQQKLKETLEDDVWKPTGK